MADSPLNHSWPSFSKLWMKRWSFKRASECGPCVEQRTASVSGPGSASSLSPPSIAEDVFFSMSEKKDDSCESDYEDLDPGSSVDDISGLDSSLRGSEFFRDLAEGRTAHVALGLADPRPDRSGPQSPRHPGPGMQSRQAANCSSCPGSPARRAGPDLAPSPDPGTAPAGPPEDCKEEGGGGDGRGGGGEGGGGGGEDFDTDTLPLLVRSMSTSRRHSWEAPLSPFDPGRRFSLDTTAMDSDGEREEHLQESFIFTVGPSDFADTATGEADPSRRKPEQAESELNASGRSLCSRSDILASEARAARLSRVLETSKQVAMAAGDDPDLETLHTADGHSHMLMVQKVLQELKQYHGAKPRPECRVEKASMQTWYEFLSKENDEEEEEEAEDRTEKVEKGKKVKRTLSSLKNRMTGSFINKQGKGREKEPQKEKGKERAKEREPKEKWKLCRDSSSGHQLVPGTFSSWATCSLCSKSLQRKHGLQCVSEYCCLTALPSHGPRTHMPLPHRMAPPSHAPLAGSHPHTPPSVPPNRMAPPSHAPLAGPHPYTPASVPPHRMAPPSLTPLTRPHHTAHA